MRSMRTSEGVTYKFWGNVEYESNLAARKARDQFAREMKLEGHRVRKESLSNQLSKYSGLGQPDGRIGNVYKLIVLDDTSGELHF